jgi:hypothetical protein
MRKIEIEVVIAEFIRLKGITRCPTACVSPTQGSVAAVDRVALEQHAMRRDQLRRAKIAAHARVLEVPNSPG